MSIKYLHHSKLLVRHTHYSDMSLFWQNFLYPVNMDFGIFPAATVSHVNRELEHLKPIFQDVLTESSINFSLFLCFRR